MELFGLTKHASNQFWWGHAEPGYVGAVSSAYALPSRSAPPADDGQRSRVVRSRDPDVLARRAEERGFPPSVFVVFIASSAFRASAARVALHRSS